MSDDVLRNHGHSPIRQSHKTAKPLAKMDLVKHFPIYSVQTIAV